MIIRTVQIVVALAFLLSTLAASADEASWDWSGNLELQSRFFTRDALWPGQTSGTTHLSLAGTAEVRWRNAEGNQRASFIPFLRWDDAEALLKSGDFENEGLEYIERRGFRPGDPLHEWRRHSIGALNGAPHDRIRALVSRALTHRGVAAIRPAIADAATTAGLAR